MRIVIALVLTASVATPLHAGDQPRILESAAVFAVETRLETQVQRTEPERRSRLAPSGPSVDHRLGHRWRAGGDRNPEGRGLAPHAVSGGP